MRSLGTLLVGLGVGFLLSLALSDLVSAEGVQTVAAIVLVFAGLILQRRARDPEQSIPSTIPAAPAAPFAAACSAAAASPVASASSVTAAAPAAAGLGEATDRILRLAEQQAAEHRAAAETEAARIIAEARTEATRIRDSS
ncbi:hypothetical protein [Catenuloplanes japonicus]|uniref:hypothetical protein n=1 Tax=Catenuloplanes japonicus TaxID=33876 RepID=UPI0012F98BC8|nr:hypothetical protein [Catenuloplanes japonicus]